MAPLQVALAGSSRADHARLRSFTAFVRMSMLGRVGWEDERRSGSSSGHAQSSASEAVIEMESSAVTSSSDPPKETMPLTSMKKWNTPVNWGAAGRVKAWHHSEICLEMCSFSICSFRLPDARRGRRQVNLRCRELVYGKLLNSRASVSFCIRFSLWPLASESSEEMFSSL